MILILILAAFLAILPLIITLNQVAKINKYIKALMFVLSLCALPALYYPSLTAFCSISWVFSYCHNGGNGSHWVRFFIGLWTTGAAICVNIIVVPLALWAQRKT
jgi:hypothetical protein